MINIAILGFGVVGSGVLEIINKNAVLMDKTLNKQVQVKKILDIRDFSDHEYAHLFTKNFEDILNDDSISIVAEVIGGKNAAYEFTKKCLQSGKSVVTSNKELVATHGTELIRLAQENNVHYMFEASVGGAIPVLRQLKKTSQYTKIDTVMGILNGTTNYILTKMFAEGSSFDDALEGAQKSGYAEADPTADVEGIDAARKIAIIMSIITGKTYNPDSVYTEGISKITSEDVKYADMLGCSIKLVGLGINEEKNTYARVSPLMVNNTHPIAGINDVYNGIMFKDEMTGDILLYGRGAGMLPTAAAVVSDIVDIIKSQEVPQKFVWTNEENSDIIDFKETKTSFFVRVEGEKDLVEKIFNDAEFITPVVENETAFVTPVMKEKDFEDKLLKIKENVKVVSIIRKYN